MNEQIQMKFFLLLRLMKAEEFTNHFVCEMFVSVGAVWCVMCVSVVC